MSNGYVLMSVAHGTIEEVREIENNKQGHWECSVTDGMIQGRLSNQVMFEHRPGNQGVSHTAMCKKRVRAQAKGTGGKVGKMRS